jgi:hypothetical protein
MMRILRIQWALVCVLVALAQTTLAENIVFPTGPGIGEKLGYVSIKKFGAKGDGKTDDTAAIQKAIDTIKGAPFTLYFPNGTYLISDSVGMFNCKAHSRDRFINYQGQSEAGTVLRLKDSADGFDNPEKPKIVFSMFHGRGTGDAMHAYFNNMTIDVGSGNPGAVGLRFMTNNTGGMYHVTIRSSDPEKRGAVGLDTSQHQNGPALIKHVTVDGFDVGVKTGNTFAMVYEFLTLRNQREIAFHNRVARTTIRKLVSENAVPAVVNEKHAHLTLIGAKLTGGKADAAIVSRLKLPKIFLRDIEIEGYAHAVKTAKGTFVDGSIDEWADGECFSLFGAEPRTLRLPVKETPEIPWEEDLAKWEVVTWNKHQEDITQRLQAAIDRAAKEGKTTVWIPARGPRTNHSARITAPIRVHGSVNRIIGMCGRFGVRDPNGVFEKSGEAAFVFEDLTSDAVVVERFFYVSAKPNTITLFDNRSDAAIVIKNFNQHGGVLKKPTPGKTWFFEDISPPARHSGVIVGEGERFWARQYNPESYKAEILQVKGGQLWILGLKTEGRAVHVRVENGGKAEVLGGVSYQSWAKQPLNPPMFIVEEGGEGSFTLGLYWFKDPFETIVEETRDGETRQLPLQRLKDHWHLNLYRSGKR